VSICIITYNSGKYIVQTLDSAYDQDYGPLELVISDDGSSDDTSVVCREWISRRGGRFSRVVIDIATHNRGIAANANRATGMARGKYIKLLAGDDVLCQDCISRYVQHMQTTDVELCFSMLTRINQAGAPADADSKSDTAVAEFFQLPMDCRARAYARTEPFLNIPTQFMCTDLARRVRFDESIPMLEDLPFVMRCLLDGVRIGYLPIVTVKYRVHSGSVQSGYSKRYIASCWLALSRYRAPLLMQDGLQGVAVLVLENLKYGLLTLSPRLYYSPVFTALRRRAKAMLSQG
jgi:alpha-1,3-rhamnosyltransferase